MKYEKGIKMDKWKFIYRTADNPGEIESNIYYAATEEQAMYDFMLENFSRVLEIDIRHIVHYG